MSNRPILPRWQFFDNNGDPLSGGKLFWYQTGTSTPKPTFSDPALATLNSNPVILDAAGYAPDIFMDSTDYKLVVKNAADVTQYTADPVFAVPAGLRGSTINSQTGDYTIVAADSGGIIRASGTWTLHLLAAAAAGNGYLTDLINSGSGTITVDPAGAETIDGLSTIAVPAGFSTSIFSTGNEWETMGRTGLIPVRSTTLTVATPSVDFVLPSPDLIYQLRITNAASSAGSPLLLRFSTDGGATFLDGASDYEYAMLYNVAAAASGVGDSTESSIFLTTSLVSGGGVNGVVEFTPGAAAHRASVLMGHTNAAEPSGTYFRTHHIGGRRAADGAIDAVRVVVASGNLAIGSRFSLSAIWP